MRSAHGGGGRDGGVVSLERWLEDRQTAIKKVTHRSYYCSSFSRVLGEAMHARKLVLMCLGYTVLVEVSRSKRMLFRCVIQCAVIFLLPAVGFDG